MRRPHFISALALSVVATLSLSCRRAQPASDARPAPVAEGKPSGSAVAETAKTDVPPSVAPLADEESERHKLFQAAAMTRDQQTMRRVGRKLKLFDEKNRPTEQYRPFIDQHTEWALNNREFVREVNEPAKAREYVKKHL